MENNWVPARIGIHDRTIAWSSFSSGSDFDPLEFLLDRDELERRFGVESFLGPDFSLNLSRRSGRSIRMASGNEDNRELSKEELIQLYNEWQRLPREEADQFLQANNPAVRFQLNALHAENIARDRAERERIEEEERRRREIGDAVQQGRETAEGRVEGAAGGDNGTRPRTPTASTPKHRPVNPPPPPPPPRGDSDDPRSHPLTEEEIARNREIDEEQARLRKLYQDRERANRINEARQDGQNHPPPPPDPQANSQNPLLNPILINRQPPQVPLDPEVRIIPNPNVTNNNQTVFPPFFNPNASTAFRRPHTRSRKNMEELLDHNQLDYFKQQKKIRQKARQAAKEVRKMREKYPTPEEEKAMQNTKKPEQPTYVAPKPFSLANISEIRGFTTER